MQENDEPWKLPEAPKLSQAPKLLPQVPELTIISTDTKPNTKSNFLQRAILTEKNLKPQVGSNTSPKSQNIFQPVVSDHRRGSPVGPLYPKSTTNILKEDNRVFSPPVLTKPAVPDITILYDDDGKKKENPTEKVFTNSYKEMLIHSHDNFMRQFNREKASIANQVPLPRFKQNPLSRYNPSPETKTLKDGNSSSILSDIDVTQSNMKRNDGNGEEVTFKKVAEMLSEIQKLVVTEKSPQASISPSTSDHSQPKAIQNEREILKQLARTYLTAEELIHYDVESELNELEKIFYNKMS